MSSVCEGPWRVVEEAQYMGSEIYPAARLPITLPKGSL